MVARRLPWRPPWYLWIVVAGLLLAGIEARAPQLLRGEGAFVVVPGLVLLILAAMVLWELPPALVFCAALVLTLFSGHWNDVGLPGFPFLPDRILLIAVLLALLLRSPGAADLPPVRVRAVHLLMLLAVLYAVASAVLVGTIGVRAGVFALLDRMGAIPFLMLLIAPAIFPGPRERKWLLATLMGIGLYLGLTAIFETVGPRSLVFPHYIVTLNPSHGLESSAGGTQAAGPFASVVTEGFACYACGIASVIAFFTWRGSLWRWVAAVAAVLSLAGSFLSLERGVWVGAVAGALAVGLLARESRRWLLPSAIAAAVVVIALLTLFPTLGSATSSRVNDKYPVWDRQNQTAAALRMVETKPLFGFGWNNYANTATPYFRLGGSYPLTGYPSSVGVNVGPNGKVTTVNSNSVSGALHNSYLTYAVELGLVGAALWLSAVLWGLGSAIFRPVSSVHRPWRLGLLAVSVCFLVVAAFDPLNQGFTQLILWSWAGVVVGCGTRNGAPQAVAVWPAKRRTAHLHPAPQSPVGSATA